MQFDPDNNIVKLCAKGMSMEGEGKKYLFLLEVLLWEYSALVTAMSTEQIYLTFRMYGNT